MENETFEIYLEVHGNAGKCMEIGSIYMFIHFKENSEILDEDIRNGDYFYFITMTSSGMGFLGNSEGKYGSWNGLAHN